MFFTKRGCLLYIFFAIQLHALDDSSHLTRWITPIIPVVAATAGYFYWKKQHHIITEQQSTINLLGIQNEQLKLQLRKARSPFQNRLDAMTRKRDEQKKRADEHFFKLYQTVLADPDETQLALAKNILNSADHLVNYKYKGRTVMHHAMLYHRVELLAFLLTHKKYIPLIDAPDIQGKTPRTLISHQRNNKSLLEAAYNKKQFNLCKELFRLGAGDYKQTNKLFSRESLKSLKQQCICLHELRIKQNLLDNGCIICLEKIDKDAVAIHDCCYTASHFACIKQAQEHNSRCPTCRHDSFNLITTQTLESQKKFASGLQMAFNE